MQLSNPPCPCRAKISHALPPSPLPLAQQDAALACSLRRCSTRNTLCSDSAQRCMAPDSLAVRAHRKMSECFEGAGAPSAAILPADHVGQAHCPPGCCSPHRVRTWRVQYPLFRRGGRGPAPFVIGGRNQALSSAALPCSGLRPGAVRVTADGCAQVSRRSRWSSSTLSPPEICPRHFDRPRTAIALISAEMQGTFRRSARRSLPECCRNTQVGYRRRGAR